MAFWGVEVKPGKPFTHQFDGSKGRLHISMATLGFGTAITKSTLQCNIGNKSPVYLCSLYPGKTESLQLNLEFEEDGGVIFSVIGPRSIHLCGYYIASGRNGSNAFEESESYGEDIGDTETDGSDFSDEDGYEDSFIDDDANLEVSPPSPISNEEEVSHDSRPKGRKGSQRRLRKKYQLVESDDDGCLEEKITVNDSMHAQSMEIDNEDSRPIASLFKDKSPGRVSDQQMDDKVDRGTADAENKNGEDGGHLVIEAKLKTDNVVADTQAPREAEPLDHLVGPCTVLDVGDIKKSKKKKKGKEMETKSSCNGHSIELENGVQDEPAMDKMTQDLLPGNEEHQQHADDEVDAENKNSEDGGLLVIEAKLKTDNVVAESKAPREAEPLDHLVGPCTVLVVGDMKKSKKKKKGKEKETKSSCNDHSIELENGVQDEPEMDKMTQDLLPGNEEHQQHADDEVDAENKNSEDGGLLVIEAKLKTDNVVAESKAPREAEPLDHLVGPCTVLDVGDMKKSKKKKKGKEKETKSSCNDHSIELENGVQDEPEMDKMTQDLLLGNEEHQQHADDEVDAENKNSEDGGHLVIEAKLKTDNVVADSQAPREADPLDHLVDPCTVLDVGDMKKSKKKKKGKEKETKSSCNDHSIKLENGVQDEPKMDKMTQDLLPGNEEHQQHVDDEKTETTDKILPSSQADQGQDERPKKKRKERSKEETHSNADGDNVALPSAEMDPQKRPKKKKKEYEASHPKAGDGNDEGIIQDSESNRDTAGSDIHKFSEGKEQHQKLTNEIVDNGAHDLPDGNQSEDKKVKKKKKKSKGEGNVEVAKSDVPVAVERGGEMMKEDGNNMADAKPSQVRTLSNGLVVQELEMGTEGGKIAALGKKISIHYTGKLKENGVIFESNAGQAPFKFRLGKGEVIEGWDIGLEGMRVGEKRRLEIPPSMTSKNGGHSDTIPPDSWLVYDFELVKVH